MTDITTQAALSRMIERVTSDPDGHYASALIASCEPLTIIRLCQALASLTAERDELQAQVEALRASIKPISVKDRLPPKNVEVFVFFAGQCQTLWTTGQYTGSQHDKHGWCYPAENNGSTHNGGDPVVTHWLPMEVLPNPDNARKEGD